MMGRFLLLLTIAVSAITTAAVAEDRGISSVRKAAIERMQSRLGGIRGSIAPGDINVRLTTRMIEMRRPHKPSEDRTRRPAVSQNSLRSSS